MSKKSVTSLRIIILLLAAGFKVVLLLEDVFPFNSDEAIVGLMAKHILDGERPIFFYGQAYMGSLDAWLVAGGFAILGEKVWVIRLVQTLLYLATIALSMFFVKLNSESDWQPVITGIFLAFPTVTMMLYTTISLGGYGESLLLGSLLFVAYALFRRTATGTCKSLLYLVFIGFISGFSFWVNGITLVYSLPVTFLSIMHVGKNTASHRNWGEFLAKLGALAAGLLVGMIPWITFVASNGIVVILGENLGKVVDVSGEPYFFSALLHLRNLILFGVTVIFGIRPPWGVDALAKPILPLAIAAWVLIFVLYRKSIKAEQGNELIRIIFLVSLVLGLGFVFTPFGNDPSGRYFLPVIHMLAILAGYVLGRVAHRPLIPGAIILVIVAFNILGIVESAKKNPPGLTTQFDLIAQVDHSYDDKLIHFLELNDEKTGYTNYWVAYPLAFHSDEEIVFVPELPYHQDFRYTSRDNRYPVYSEIVTDGEKTAYITTNHPQLDARIRKEFLKKSITWQEKKIGDYLVFYNLSQRVEPGDLDLGLIE